jgi:protein-L-isoaspartate(D-aspartate) O-methyltransferase
VTDPSAARERYADAVCARAGVQSAALRRAFATVAREHYLGAGPWPIFDPGMLAVSGSMYRPTPDADPRHVYEDVLIGIDTTRGLNNGSPSGHALWIGALDPRPGDHLVHIGCGTGYYTALLREMVGPEGRVTAIELDPTLAARARDNLAGYPNVRVVQGDGGTFDFGAADAIYVNAGATHPLPLWLDQLAPAGRLTLPLVRWPVSPARAAASGCGVLMKITRGPEQCRAQVVSLVQIFPCLGAVDADADRRLQEAFDRGVDRVSTYLVRRDHHAEGPACWLHGEGYCFTAPGSVDRSRLG